jgi:hypothetical protein
MARIFKGDRIGDLSTPEMLKALQADDSPYVSSQDAQDGSVSPIIPPETPPSMSFVFLVGFLFLVTKMMSLPIGTNYLCPFSQ